MTREVRFLDEAVTELHDAAAWYQERSEGLGLVFLSVIDTAIDSISRWPGSGALVDGVPGDVVLAIAHERRQPKYWIDRAER